MRFIVRFLTIRFSLFLLASATVTASLTAAEPLPQGHAGLAAKYASDNGIGADPAVIFADDFESYGAACELRPNWTDVYHCVRVATETENVFSGSRSVELLVPQQSTELSNTVAKQLTQGEDLVFFRYYSKFDGAFDVLGSSHNGASINASYYVGGRATPGVPANGTNKFLVSLESWRDSTSVANPGHLNVYVYHPEQRFEYGDHLFPSGLVLPYGGDPAATFGSSFVPRDDVVPQLNRWYCYEFMVQANTPGVRDGRIAIWLDGQLAADFPNLRLRDVSSLKIDRVSLEFHIRSNTASDARKWYDNVVVARSYIGPLATSPSETLQGTPTDPSRPSGTPTKDRTRPEKPNKRRSRQ